MSRTRRMLPFRPSNLPQNKEKHPQKEGKTCFLRIFFKLYVTFFDFLLIIFAFCGIVKVGKIYHKERRL